MMKLFRSPSEGSGGNQDKGSGAHFSECRKYRYALWRIWDESKPLAMFVGLNPSKADEGKNDNTITKVCKIARNNGFGGVYMMNLFAYVSTDPAKLLLPEARDVLNDTYLVNISAKCEKIVFAWGNFKQCLERAKEVVSMFKYPFALHINKNGSPKHPLYCSDATVLIPYTK